MVTCFLHFYMSTLMMMHDTIHPNFSYTKESLFTEHLPETNPSLSIVQKTNEATIKCHKKDKTTYSTL